MVRRHGHPANAGLRVSGVIPRQTPIPAYQDRLVTVYLGDCRQLLSTLPSCSVDSVVTDPPAGIEFMAQPWDTFRQPGTSASRPAFVAFLRGVMAQCLRVLRPGGHTLVWAIPRTSHWTATAVEDAGFEIRDVITHHFGSGFPKSRNLTDAWRGWGTALKPASEHWILARRPLSEGNTALNVERWRTGALNIDACRIPLTGLDRNIVGRWPANVLLSHAPACHGECSRECPVAELDQQSGISKTRRIHSPSDCGGNTWGGTFQIHRGPRGYDDAGGASRFFYVAKPSVQERDAGLAESPVRIADPYGQHRGRRSQDKRRFDGRAPRLAHNHHPTVKSVVLMRYLCQLVTPPGGTILDCFAGSGSTLIAAKSLGFHAIGIERDPAYVEIICRRVHHAQPPGSFIEGSA
ncbi:MAG: DNA methyltransferase [Solirubrobacteraceae bacterium]